LASFVGSRKTCLLDPLAKWRVCELVVSVPVFSFSASPLELADCYSYSPKSCDHEGNASGWCTRVVPLNTAVRAHRRAAFTRTSLDCYHWQVHGESDCCMMEPHSAVGASRRRFVVFGSVGSLTWSRLRMKCRRGGR
jgi:hypothetical protein